MWQKLSRCYPSQLELVSLFLLILAFYVALSNYPLLPDTIPTHFDAQGNPDDWSNKRAIFSLPIVSAVISILLTAFNVLLAIVDNPKRFINLPKRRKEALTRAQAETLRIFVNRCLYVLKILMLCLFTYLTWQTVEIALGKASTLGIPFWLFIGALLVFAGAASHNWWKFDLAISYTLLPSQSILLSNQYFL
jgi:uncharacterized membrane protein